MPLDMDDDSRKVWHRVVREMGTSRIIRAADTDVLRCYCEAVSRYAAAQRLYIQSGPILKDRGHLTKNPLHQVVRENADMVRLFARELGLTPSARAGLQLLETGPTGGEIDDLIGPPPRLLVVGGSDA